MDGSLSFVQYPCVAIGHSLGCLVVTHYIGELVVSQQIMVEILNPGGLREVAGFLR